MSDRSDMASDVHAFDSRTVRLKTFLQLFPFGYLIFWLLLLVTVYFYQGGFPTPSSRSEGWIGFSVLFLLSAGLAWSFAIFFSLTTEYEVSATRLVQRRFLRRPISINWEDVVSISYHREDYWSVFTLHGTGKELYVISEVQDMASIAEMALAKIARERWIDPKRSLVAMMKIAGRTPPIDLMEDNDIA